MRENKGQSLLEFPSTYVVVDIETTGLDPAYDSLIEVAALKVENSVVVDSFSSLINPIQPINSYISDLTGITNEQLSSAPSITTVLPELWDFIGNNIVVGHNVNFDINFLYDNFLKVLGKSFSNDFIDTLRLSKKYFKNAPSFRLASLASFLNISVDISHRALSDCHTANALYTKLVSASEKIEESEQELLSSLNFDSSNPFYNKRVVLKGLPQSYSYAFFKAVMDKCNAKFGDIFYSSADYIIFSRYTYKRYTAGEYSEKFEKADKLASQGTLTILSESDWCQMLNIPVLQSESSLSNKSSTSAKDIITDKTDFDETHPLYGKLFVFTGTLEKMTRKDAMQMVVDFGGLVKDSVTKKTNYLVLGNNDYCPLIKDGKSSKQKKAEALKLAGNDIEIISENVFYDMIFEE